MVIKVVELCEVEPYQDGKTSGIRTYTYDSPKENLSDAIKDIEKDFDCDRILWSEDDYDGSTLSSEVIEYSRVMD